MSDRAFVPVARVVRAHGLNGELAVVGEDGLPFMLEPGVEVWFSPPTLAVRSATVTDIRETAKGTLVSFDLVHDRSTAEQLKRAVILMRGDLVPEPEEDDEFDPVGCIVTDVIHGSLGTITDVIITGANDVWVVDGRYGEVLIPVIPSVVLEIDDESRAVSTELLPGLLPEGDTST